MSANKVSLKITYLQLITEVNPAILHLGSLVYKDIDTMVKIANAKGSVVDEMEKYHELRKDISEKECIMGDDKKPVVENDRYTYSDKDKESRVLNLMRDLEKKEITIKVEPIAVKELKGVEGVTPNSIEALKNFITL